MTAIYVSQDGEAGFSAPVIALRREARLRLTISLKRPMAQRHPANSAFAPDSNVVAFAGVERRFEEKPASPSPAAPMPRRAAHG